MAPTLEAELHIKFNIVMHPAGLGAERIPIRQAKDTGE